jgi:hypothetical protein
MEAAGFRTFFSPAAIFQVVIPRIENRASPRIISRTADSMKINLNFKECLGGTWFVELWKFFHHSFRSHYYTDI